MITFLSTRRAITCAVAINKALAAHGREHPDENVRVRIGLNVGEVLERGGHPFGAAVNATQRVASYAKGGQIFVSEPVRHLAGTIPDVTFRDRGPLHAQGLLRALAALRGRVGAARRRRRRRSRANAGAGCAPPATAAPRRGGAGRGPCLRSSQPSAPPRAATTTLDRVAANSVGIIDPGSGDIVGEVRVGKKPGRHRLRRGTAPALGREPRVGTISEIDPDSRSSSTRSTPATDRGESPPAKEPSGSRTDSTNQLFVFDPVQDTRRRDDRRHGRGKRCGCRARAASGWPT